MKTLLRNSKIRSTVFILFCLFFTIVTFSQSGTVTSGATGNWNADATWTNIDITRSGTVTYSSSSTTVTGTGTSFLTELTVGSVIERTNGNAIGTVASIASNTSLTLTSNSISNSPATQRAYRTSAGPPSPVDTVIVDDNDVVTVNLNSVCAALTIAGGANDSTLIISGTNSLTVNGAVTINAGTGANDDKFITVGSGSLSCSSVTMATTGDDTTNCEITISTGTVNVTGNITMNGTAARNAIRFSSSGILNIGGTMTGGSLAPSTGTVNYNAAGNQTVGAYTFNNLTLSGTGSKTLGGALTIGSNLSIATGVVSDLGTFRHTAATLTLGGTAQTTGTSYGGTGSPAATINSTFFATNTGYVNVGSCSTYSLSSIAAAAPICTGNTATINVTSTVGNLPNGTYTVFYTLSAPNSGTGSVTMTVSSGIGSFTTTTLVNSGATSITINLIRLGCVSVISSGNTATITVNQTPSAITISPTSATICNGAIQTLTATNYINTSPQTNSSGAITVNIPDNSATGATTTVAVSGIPVDATVTGISVNFNITHTYDGDLEAINLKAPNGSILNLVNSRGGSGDNFTNTVINSSSATLLSTGVAPFTGTFAPDAVTGVGATSNVSNVTSFASLYSVPNGNWVLSARDNVAVDTGTITSWSITITYTLPSITWTTNTTALFVDPAASATPYVAQNISTVYAKPNTNQTYTATATAATGCTSSTPITITVNPLPQGSLTANGPFCATGAGQLTWTASAGTGPYTVIYNDGVADRTVSGVVSGTAFATFTTPVTANTTYTLVSVTGANTCVRTTGFTGASATITVNPLPQGSLTANGPFCATGAGQLTWTATAGTGPYTVIYNDGVADRTVSGVVSGTAFATFTTPVTANTTYTLVSVTGANSCVRTTGFTGASATITVNPLPQGSLTANGPFCATGAGQLTWTATAGTGPYTVIYNDGVANRTVSGVVSGTAFATFTTPVTANTTYTLVSVTGANSCVRTTGFTGASATITVNPLPQGSLTANGPFCATGAGQLTWTATAGTGPYTVIYNDGVANRTVSGVVSGTAFATFTTPVTANTTYTLVSVTGANSCVRTTGFTGASATITVNPLPQGSLTANGPFCASGAGQLTWTATTGTGPYTVIYNDGVANRTVSGVVSGTAFATFTTPVTANTTYTLVSVTGANSCVRTTGFTGSSASITVNPNLPASVSIAASPSGAICSGTNVTFTATPTNGGTPSYQWKLNGGNVGANSATYSNAAIANGDIVTVVMTSTASPCLTGSPATSNAITMTVNPRATASVISGSAAICSGSPTNIQVAITGGTSPYTVVYTSGSASGYISGSNISVAPSSTTTYTITSVTDANGCVGIGNSGSAVITIDSTTSTDGGTTWSNGTPSATKSVVFDGSTGTIGANFAGCSLRLTNNATVTVSSGFTVTLEGRLTVDSGSTFTLNNNANLLQNNTLTNSGTIVVKRNSSALKRLDYTLWSSPVTGQGLYAFSKTTLPNRFYVYNTTTNNYSNSVGFSLTGLQYPSPLVSPNGINGTDSNNVPFASAKGYLIRSPWDHPTTATNWSGTFTGVPNNGDITYTMTNGGVGQRFNLVGNPYPSPMSMSTFVSDNNTKITGTLYFWRDNNNTTTDNAYCTWAGGTFTSNGQTQAFNPNGIIRTGQGFFVEALNASTTIDFKNGQRSSNTANQFFRTTNTNVSDSVETNRFWLNLSNANGEFSQMAAGYMTGATDGVDLYDGKNINTGDSLLNSILNATDYTIQGKALPFNPADVIPLSMKITTAGNYTIAIDHVDGLFTGGSQAIYLKDNLTATEHNLQTGAYNFASAAGTFTNRFEIIYQSQLGVGNPTFTENTVIIYNQNNNFVVNTGNTIMASIKVFDIRGRVLQEKKGINANQTIIGGGLANQVLLVQITSEDGVMVTKKVIR